MMTGIYVRDLSDKKRNYNYNFHWDGDSYTVDQLLKEAPCFARFTNLDEPIKEMIVVRCDLRMLGHWETYFRTVTDVYIKVDLVQNCYRLIYDAVLPENFGLLLERFKLRSFCTFRDLFTILLDVASINGPWYQVTTVDKYDCHEFVIVFMKRFGRSNSEILPYELCNTVLRDRPPLITEYGLDLESFRLEYLHYY